jgi:hypothetical protein
MSVWFWQKIQKVPRRLKSGESGSSMFKNSFLKLSGCLQVIAIFFSLVIAPTVQAQNFHPEGDADLAKDGIWVDVAFSGTNTTSTFRAKYNHAPDKVFEVLTDTTSMAILHKGNYADARTLSKATFDKIVQAKPKNIEDLLLIMGETRLKSDHNRSQNSRWTDYTYCNFNFPWPLSNRWTVNTTKVDESGNVDGHYKFTFTMAVGNFTTMSGYWELVPTTNGGTEFRGVYNSDPGIDLPKFATKLGTKMAMKREYDENKAALKKRYGNK